jgi:hypothetical protein
VSHRRRAARFARLLALLGASLPAAAGAAGSAELARCAAIAAPEARLACYDALAGRAAQGQAAARVAAPTTPSPAAAPAAAAAPPAPSPSATPATTTTAPPTTPPAAADAQSFGLTKAQQHAVPEGPATIQAVVARVADDGAGHMYVVLDNAQTWLLPEPDSRLSPGDTVTIRRASLGSYLMVTPSKHSYRVRRTR